MNQSGNSLWRKFEDSNAKPKICYICSYSKLQTLTNAFYCKYFVIKLLWMLFPFPYVHSRAYLSAKSMMFWYHRAVEVLVPLKLEHLSCGQFFISMNNFLSWLWTFRFYMLTIWKFFLRCCIGLEISDFLYVILY